MPYMPGTNSGHGHVWERPDGVKARCGGPGLCSQCSKDEAARVKFVADYSPGGVCFDEGSVNQSSYIEQQKRVEAARMKLLQAMDLDDERDLSIWIAATTAFLKRLSDFNLEAERKQ